jgi:hypothetical protein
MSLVMFRADVIVMLTILVYSPCSLAFQTLILVTLKLLMELQVCLRRGQHLSCFLHLLQHSHYYVRIARFMPRVDVVQKHNTAARRLFIRGHNGKIYPYLVVNDSGLGDARREERVLQLLRMLNHYLGKQKVATALTGTHYVLHWQTPAETQTVTFISALSVPTTSNQ